MADEDKHSVAQKPTSIENYDCRVCGKTFKKTNLTRHMLIHSEEKLYKCKTCHKNFHRLNNLQRHERTHTGEKPFECEVCHKSFGDQSILKRHKLYHTGEKPYECEICNKTFFQSTGFKSHMRVHTGEKPFTCQVCKKTFRNPTTLKRHASTHTPGEKSHKCEVCHVSFDQLESLKSHVCTLSTKDGSASYKCEDCNSIFSDPDHLAMHMVIHVPIPSNDFGLKCEVCGRCFRYSSGLTNHMRVHTGEKPYECEICHKCFSRTGILKSHMRTHTGERPYKCEICNRSYKFGSDFKYHMRSRHSGINKKLSEKEDFSNNVEKAEDVEIESEIETKEFKFAPVAEVYVENTDSNHSFISEDIENIKEENDESKEENESPCHENETENKTEVTYRLLSNIIDELTPTQKQICYICLNHKSDFGIEFSELIAQLRKSFIFENADYLTKIVVQMTQNYDENSSLNLLIPNEKIEIGPDFGDDYARFEHLFIKLNPVASSILGKIKPEMEVDSDDLILEQNVSEYKN